MAAQPEIVLLTAEQFLRIDFGSDVKAELDDGVIRMMSGGTRAHARVQMNLYRYLGDVLRGSGCRPFGSDMAVRIGAYSVRYPDVTVDCDADRGEDGDDDLVLADPRLVVEILSPSTRRHDETIKLNEYQALRSVDTIALVDADRERLRIVQRTGPDAWADRTHADPVDLDLPALGITIPHDEIFARD